MKLNNLIKKQEKEFNEKFLNFRKDSESVNFKDRNEDTLAFELKSFISKIRLQTAEKVIKRMTGMEINSIENLYEGYNQRIEEEKQIAKNIIKEINL